MLQTKRSRLHFMLVIFLAGAGILIFPTLLPEKFHRVSSIGFLHDGSSAVSAEEVHEFGLLDEATWSSAVKRCSNSQAIEGGWAEEISLMKSSIPEDRAMAILGYSSRLVCQTTQDKVWSALSYLMAVISLPLLFAVLLFGRKWANAGK